MNKLLLLASVAILSFNTMAFAADASVKECGVERWPVKIGVDKDISKVNLTPVKATIYDLVHSPAPANPNAQRDTRFPAELQTYEVTATLTLIKREADSDYHLVISDGHLTMIIESPAPDCALGSVLSPQMAEVRKALEAKFGKRKSKKIVSIPVTVTGILFFDKKHGQTGLAPNGVELHPLLSIKFN